MIKILSQTKKLNKNSSPYYAIVSDKGNFNTFTDLDAYLGKTINAHIDKNDAGYNELIIDGDEIEIIESEVIAATEKKSEYVPRPDHSRINTVIMTVEKLMRSHVSSDSITAQKMSSDIVPAMIDAIETIYKNIVRIEKEI